MPADLHGHPGDVGEAFVGSPQRVGWFRLYFDDER
jgi:hypothetical protein